MGKPATSFKLPKGNMPAIGLGVWQAKPDDTRAAVKAALKAGYRHIDTAFIYLNEADVGQAIRESGVPREEVWVTTKIWNSHHRPSAVAKGLETSLKRLGTDFVDLLLVHFPIAFKHTEKSDGKIITMPKDDNGRILTDFDLSENFMPTWRAMEEVARSGKARNIGVCNWNRRRLDKLLSEAEIPPAILQMEINLACDMPQLIEYARERGIVVQAYSPFGSTGAPHRNNALVKELAEKYGCDPATILVSWPLCRGLCVLPKSVTPSRIEANLRTVDLDDAEVDALNREARKGKIVRAIPKGDYYGVDVYENEHEREAKL